MINPEIVCPYCMSVLILTPEQQHDYEFICGGCNKDFNFKDFLKLKILRIEDGYFVTFDELLSFIGKEKYYNNVFEKISKNISSPFNWAAFLFDGYWLLYHRMILYALLLYIIVPIFVEAPESSIPKIVYLVIKIIIGFSGNKIFYNFSISRILKIKRNYSNDFHSTSMIESKGKPSEIYVIIGIAIQFLIILLLFIY